MRGKVGPAHDHLCADVVARVARDAEMRRKYEKWSVENAQADDKFQELLRREQAAGQTKPCPKCKMAITKNAGCDHMKCTRCHTDFWWSQQPGGRDPGGGLLGWANPFG
jgi:hypothetical protein